MMAFTAPTPLPLQPKRSALICAPRRVRSARCCAQVKNEAYSAQRFANFRDRWSGEWNGFWQQVDAMGNVIKTTACVRNLKPGNDGSSVHQRNWVEDPSWHRDNTPIKEYNHSVASFENAPMLTTVHENGDGLQVSIGRFGGLEKTVHHPARDDVRFAIVLLYAGGAMGFCTYQREVRGAPYESFWDEPAAKSLGKCRAVSTRVDRNGQVLETKEQVVDCGPVLEVDDSKRFLLIPFDDDVSIRFPRDIYEFYGKEQFTIDMLWKVDDKTAKLINFVVEKDGKYVYEDTTVYHAL